MTHINFAARRFIILCLTISSLSIAYAKKRPHIEENSNISALKAFDNRVQFRTWSIGFNAGVLIPTSFIGSNDFTDWDAKLGYGASVRKQLGHIFGLELDFYRGEVAGNNESALGHERNNRRSFYTQLDYITSIVGAFNFAKINFLRKEKTLNFIVKGGYGVAGYSYSFVNAKGDNVDFKGTYGPNKNARDIMGQFFLLGVGVDFKLSDRVNFNLGYNTHFLDSDNLDGTQRIPEHKDKFSYSYAGIEFSLGPSAKVNIDWVNPAAILYDELKNPSNTDSTLSKEIKALKRRIAILDSTTSLLNRDSSFYVSSNKLLRKDTAAIKDASFLNGLSSSQNLNTASSNGYNAPLDDTLAYSRIQFEFNSSILKTSSYLALNKTVTDLKITGRSVKINGYASIEGTEAHNLQLSKDRANAVKIFLVNAGVKSKKIKAYGWGTANPIASNDTEEGRVLNRRVEFEFP